MRPLLRKINSLFGAIDGPAGDEESGDTECGDAATECSNTELLQFFDTLPANPHVWDAMLRKQANLRREVWVRFHLEFVLRAGEREARASPVAVTRLSVIESEDGIDRLIDDLDSYPAAEDWRGCWLSGAELEKVDCDDRISEAAARVSLEGHGCGHSPVPAVARRFSGEYWIPAPDLLEPGDGWTPIRHYFAAIFAGGKTREYFESLATRDPKHEEWTWVRRDLPFVVAFLLWADVGEKWARDAARRWEGEHVAVPTRWYEWFLDRAPEWLEMRKPAGFVFRLNLLEAVSKPTTYRARVIAKCVFEKSDRPVASFAPEGRPDINGTA